jgi:hypothetical protein
MPLIAAVRLDSVLLNRPLDPADLNRRLDLKPDTVIAKPRSAVKPFRYILTRTSGKSGGGGKFFIPSANPMDAGRWVSGGRGGGSIAFYSICLMEGDSAVCDTAEYPSLSHPEIQALLKEVPEVDSLMRKSNAWTLSGLGGLIAGAALIAIAYQREEFNAVTRTMYWVGGAACILGFGAGWYGAALDDDIVRLYNEQATRKARITSTGFVAGLHLAFGF